MSNRRLFAKWSRWLARIERELHEVVIHHSMFHALANATDPYVGKEHDGWTFGSYIAQGSYAYLSMAIRRLTEPPPTPKKSSIKPLPLPPPARKKKDPRLVISLAVLLDELAANSAILTRVRQRKMYRTAMRSLPRRIGMGAADNAFDQIAGRANCNSIPMARIRGDQRAVKKAAKRIKRRVDKIHAHIERDRRRIGKPIGLNEIDAALKVLLEVHQRYALLIQGRDVKNLMNADLFDISPQLQKIWPQMATP